MNSAPAFNPCGYRWPSEDGKDMHGCCLEADHFPAIDPWHRCSCPPSTPLHAVLGDLSATR